MTTSILRRKFMVPLVLGTLVLIFGVYILFFGPAKSLPPQDGMPFMTKTTTTTMFWVGEGADAENDYISNAPSYWDEKWQTHFGGVDVPAKRCGYVPCAFTPKENAFYVALPYAEYDPAGNLKASAKTISWFASSTALGLPLLKNRWVAVSYGGKTCYGQWEDVGPNGEDDFAYVFGTSTAPTNTFGEKAGLDLSPALFTCLGLKDNAPTSWHFVDESQVPEGPWLSVVTKSGISWRQ